MTAGGGGKPSEAGAGPPKRVSTGATAAKQTLSAPEIVCYVRPRFLPAIQRGHDLAMMRRLLILVTAALCAAIVPGPIRAETTVEVVYDDGRPTEQVGLRRASGDDDVWFLRANDVARLFRATQFWNASSRKVVLGIGRTRFVLTVDTRVVVVDGEPFMMRTPVRYEDGFVLAPMEFVLEIAAQHTPRGFEWNEDQKRLTVRGAGFNATRIAFANARAGEEP